MEIALATPMQAQQAIKLRARYEEGRRALEQLKKDLLQAADDDVTLERVSR
jgi:hypothetical protein